MSFEIGDIVSVIDDVIKGKVTEVEKDKITITTSDGFPFEFHPSELVLIKNDQKELSKFSDIGMNEMMYKDHHEASKKRKIVKGTTKKDKIPPMEVDLHINSLVKSSKGMDNFDMLTIQLDTAKLKLEFAIRNRIPRIVFIHGVGEGVLKSELEFLFRKYPVEWYAASFKKYGLGATEVYVLQNPKH